MENWTKKHWTCSHEVYKGEVLYIISRKNKTGKITGIPADSDPQIEESWIIFKTCEKEKMVESG